MKRVLSLMLAFIMVLSLVPVVNAAEDTGETVLVESNGLLVTHGKTTTVMYGEFKPESKVYGTIDWQVVGNKIVAEASTNSAQVGATLTFKNTMDIPATLRFSYTFESDELEFEYEEDYPAELRGVSGSPVEMELAAGDTYTISIISTNAGYDPAVLTITNLSLSTGEDVTATFSPAQNGSYTVDSEEITEEISKTAPVGKEYAMFATAADGYQFFGWYNGSKYISYKANDNIAINENCTIYPVFIQDTVAVFGVGEARFQNLTDADTYARNGAVQTIVLVNDGILTGEHTISAGNTLLIPYNDANSLHTEATSTAIQNGGVWENVAWEQPKAYRTLTMAQGAKLTIQGSLNVGGKHSAGPFLTAGSPSGDLGMIQMAEGSNITVANGGTVYCWGYIYGDGTVTVKNGGSVHENFQFTDFRGGNATLGIAQGFLVFPLSQYYVQNIEVAATFEYGATEHVWGSIYLQGKVQGTSVKFIGNNKNLCMFVPGENGKVTKTYDPTTDRLHIDVDGDSSINPMALELGGTAINTKTFVLPINSNMTINVNSGTTMLDQSLALLPGVEMNIAKEATLALQAAEALKNDNGQYVHYTGANNLIIYDRDQWLNAYQPIYDEANQLVGANFVKTYFVYTNQGTKRLQPLAWSPTRSCTRTEEDLVDAVVDINGKLITDGFVYTTVDVNLLDYLTQQKITITGGGAAVTSSAGTGTLVMNNGAGKDIITLQPIQNSTEVEYAYIPMVSARLLNEDNSYLDTLGSAAGATFNYCAQCGKWYAGELQSHTVEITWIVDGKEFEDGTQEVCIGTKPVYNQGNDPEKEGYTFIGWSIGNDNVPEYTSANLPEATGDAVYYACFEENAPAGLLGDLDLNGKVDSDDLTKLARHIAGIEKVTGQALVNADVNGDKVVNSDDLTTHARYIAGIIKDWN